MDIKKLHFFNDNGYELNFIWNKNHWEGNIYLPKISIGLYSSISLYVLEEVNDNFIYPQMDDNHKSFKFKWDALNKFVDEFFMFKFDEDFIIKDTSSLHYEKFDGPDCETILKYIDDSYEIELTDGTIKNIYFDESNPDLYFKYNPSNKALPIHIGFSAPSQDLATTYKRTLNITSGSNIIAKISFYAETVEEDERLKIWNNNLGYTLTKDDEKIFNKSNIKEEYTDYILLNEKRKELMIEGSNIYPFIGSYKAIINAIKFFGYSNLNIIEFWRNINKNDINFGKLYHSSKYKLNKNETIRIDDKFISLPNSNFKKTNNIALTFDINYPLNDRDIYELPYTKEYFTYSIEEAFIKLFALKNKLNKEFIPTNSTIIDIIGEAYYFGLNSIANNTQMTSTFDVKSGKQLSFDIYPNNFLRISNDRYFNNYILERETNNEYTGSTIVNDIKDLTIDEIENKIISLEENNINDLNLTEKQISNYYKDFYYWSLGGINDNNENDLYDYDERNGEYINDNISAKVILKNTSFEDLTFDDISNTFDQMYPTTTFDNINYIDYHTIEWSVIFSENQMDEELNTIGESKYYNRNSKNIFIGKKIQNKKIGYFEYKNDNWIKTTNISDKKIISIKTSKKSFKEQCVDINNKMKSFDDLSNYIVCLIQQIEIKTNDIKKYGDILEYDEVLFELPYVGYYDVKLSITDKYNNISSNIFKKSIKVEPYHLDIRGFYYDARNLPDEINYNLDENKLSDETSMENFIITKLKEMTNWAIQEHLYKDNIDESMPHYSVNGEVISTGPYRFDNIGEEWYLADNINWEMSKLKPILKSARYIKNGVDVKPYTWILLGYDYSKIVGKRFPKWKLINTNTGKYIEHTGKYITFLLKEEGNYRIDLSVEDAQGNKYSISRNIIVVDNNANYKLYTPFKNDYEVYKQEKDYYSMVSVEELNELNTLSDYNDKDIEYYNDNDSSEYDDFLLQVYNKNDKNFKQ